MKKLFSLFLALLLLFLTACNTTPPAEMNNGMTNNGQISENNPNQLKDEIIIGSKSDLIELSSRIIFDATINNRQLNYYYSKVDEKVYPYCFDPICKHEDFTCLANTNNTDSGWRTKRTVFINNRFYNATPFGQIISFAFDGSDKKIEYDSGYDSELGGSSIWNLSPLAYKEYIYIYLQADETGNPHTLRFNTKTKEMEDLTEKTGNCLIPYYIYNDNIYGKNAADKMYYSADLDLNSMKIEKNYFSVIFAVGSLAVYSASSDDRIGIELYDFKTENRWTIPNETLGTDQFTVSAVTDQYIYFYVNEKILLGHVTNDRWDGTKAEVPVNKYNNGKLWRINLDGTGLVCVYDNPDYELNTNMVIYDDRVVMMGRYIHFENGEQTVWGGPLQVAVINEDGTFGEFREVEIVG